ncbi:hypothetical protein DEI92_11995 [Curtobacterium sp. MCBD17_034]|uniref:hypothetical protein n=1 Tax=unclassified Curtobacterium TaxID=257496 RepID=UPI000DA84275|nr:MULTISPECIES: hypothetical protein [unclassified Curtobacterium]PZF57982.1 hypothetical protein DEI92_11995 [Curtobacterium sp. MCBD17_034]PZM33366.1 hypothetical protein DEI90_12875 [Curtobacterium sp. MCBD17_031]WIB66708.1 hypothetical protein DEI93_12145 [Curtobacterium sp. MCBD17_035]
MSRTPRSGRAHRRAARPRVVPTAAVLAVLAVGLTGCAGITDHVSGVGTAVASSVASGVRSGLQGVTGGSIQRGMRQVAGGIDGALDAALRGAAVTTDGAVPAGFPTHAVPLVDGTVLGGGSGPAGSGWVVQVRVASVAEFTTAHARLTADGFADGAVRSDARSAFGLFRSDRYRVVLAFSTGHDGVTATYIVTPR